MTKIHSFQLYHIYRLSDELLTTEMLENRRKRIRRNSSNFEKASDSFIANTTHDSDITNDDLNAAFRSSLCEDEVVEPTQFSPNKYDDHNKENVEKKTYIVERSPTVLSKR